MGEQLKYVSYNVHTYQTYNKFIGQCSSNSTYEVAHNDRAVRLNTKQFVWVILKHLGR